MIDSSTFLDDRFGSTMENELGEGRNGSEGEYSDFLENKAFGNHDGNRRKE